MPTALIVEDEPEANKLLSMLVRLKGYQTESAYSGTEALEKIRQRMPDVVFLDLMLPDMNGHDVCRSLRSSGSVSTVPVVIVTARLTAENRIESFGVGADDYIPKPYTPDQIFEALDQSRTLKEDAATQMMEGEVPLDIRDDGETLRNLAQLRRAMQSRSGLGADEIGRINAAISEIWSSVDRMSRRRQLDQVATLSYSMTTDALTLTIRDQAGWLSGLGVTGVGDPSESLAAAHFDHIIAEEGDPCLKLIKRFKDHASG